MKSSARTIWESASRPLFVRSVWLESTSASRAHQRHFILDYEPERQQRHLQTAGSPLRRRRSRANLKHSASYEPVEFGDSNYLVESAEDLLLIGSAKVRQHEQPQQQQLKLQQKLNKTYRRPSLISRKSDSSDSSQQQRVGGEHYSRHSSLQDIQAAISSTHTNPDVRLAERVLNWLDLAGKNTSTVCYQLNNGSSDNNNGNTMESGQKKSHKLCCQPQQQQRFVQRATTAQAPLRNTNARTKALSQPKRSQSSNNVTSHHHQQQHHQQQQFLSSKHPDSMKHITIIFNKEGVPIRLNRPVRNIDLCALASSANVTRRLAGTLASARLYSGAEKVVGEHARRSSGVSHPSASDIHTLSRTAAKSLQADECSPKTVYDAKKQLHIFMPSLPKKGLIAISAISHECQSIDESASALSNTFSELCKI